MKKVMKIIAIILLCILSLPALYGGWALITDPSGGLLKMSTNELSISPFPDFLLPGIILFFVLGVGSLVVLVMVIVNKKSSGILLRFSGMIVCGWITIQMIVMQQVNWLHIFYLGCGVLMMSLKFTRRSRAA